MNDQETERRECVDNIINSSSQKKIIVAGPGTGKTTLFKKLLESKKFSDFSKSEKITLTFINKLADDLEADLGDLSEVYTFHSFCKKLLYHNMEQKPYYYPLKLSFLIANDAKFKGTAIKEEDKQKEFSKCFHELNCNEEAFEFFLERADYYNAVGFDDSLYHVLKYFQENPNHIPIFKQIIVDEYQDFNKLEVSFIDLLGEKSPILIVGDDDQAIYHDRKQASPDFIRNKKIDPQFSSFELPYCSRCSKVIVDAVNSIINEAKSRRYLKGRISKRFESYLKGKEDTNRKHPKIIHAKSTRFGKNPDNYVAKYIEKKLLKIFKEPIDTTNLKHSCVLVIGPYYPKIIQEYLHSSIPILSIFSDIKRSNDKIIAEDKPSLLDGYKLLMENFEDNLGWRIFLYAKQIFNKEYISNETKIVDMIDSSLKENVSNIVNIINKIKNNQLISPVEAEKVIKDCGESIDNIRKYIQLDSFIEQSANRTSSITFATFEGSKGLAADYVFIVGMNGGEFPKDNSHPKDDEIRKMIVGLTRTRAECHIISNGRCISKGGKKFTKNDPSVFISWINPNDIQEIEVNAQYFK